MLFTSMNTVKNIFPVSQKLSLCYNKIPCVFPCLKKVRTKFPVFPVPWPPCICSVFYRVTIERLQNFQLLLYDYLHGDDKRGGEDLDLTADTKYRIHKWTFSIGVSQVCGGGGSCHTGPFCCCQFTGCKDQDLIRLLYCTNLRSLRTCDCLKSGEWTMKPVRYLLNQRTRAVRYSHVTHLLPFVSLFERLRQLVGPHKFKICQVTF